MQKSFLIVNLGALWLTLQAVASAAPPGTNSMLVNHCRQKWLGDASMIEYCIKEQIKDYRRVESSGASQDVAARCTAQYGSDYAMIKACVTNNSRIYGSSGSSEEVYPSSDKRLPVYANGVKIDICSNGELCYFQLLRALQRLQ